VIRHEPRSNGGGLPRILDELVSGYVAGMHTPQIPSLLKTEKSSHQMLGFARRPVFDIVDQLIGEELHGAVRGPRDMRR